MYKYGKYFASTETIRYLHLLIAEVECIQPPDVVNATWYEDTKSLRIRKVIYKCYPRYKLVAGQLWKECGAGGNWTGVDPVCEGKEGEIEG